MIKDPTFKASIHFEKNKALKQVLVEVFKSIGVDQYIINLSNKSVFIAELEGLTDDICTLLEDLRISHYVASNGAMDNHIYKPSLTIPAIVGEYHIFEGASPFNLSLNLKVDEDKNVRFLQGFYQNSLPIAQAIDDARDSKSNNVTQFVATITQALGRDKEERVAEYVGDFKGYSNPFKESVLQYCVEHMDLNTDISVLTGASEIPFHSNTRITLSAADYFMGDGTLEDDTILPVFQHKFNFKPDPSSPKARLH